MADHRWYQEQFLKDMHRARERPLSAAARAAYLATSRHRFIHRYRLGHGAGNTVDETNEMQLAVLYEDQPLILGTDGTRSRHGSGLDRQRAGVAVAHGGGVQPTPIPVGNGGVAGQRIFVHFNGCA